MMIRGGMDSTAKIWGNVQPQNQEDLEHQHRPFERMYLGSYDTEDDTTDFPNSDGTADTRSSDGDSSCAETATTVTDGETQVSVNESVASIYKSTQIKPEVLVTVHLHQWKWIQEEGYPVLRFATILGAIGTIVTSVIPWCLEKYERPSVATVLLAAYAVMFSLLLLVFEFRYLMCRNPFGCRAIARTTIMKYLNVLQLASGRGWVCVHVGLLTIAQGWDLTLISGMIMVAIGLAAVATGLYAAQRLKKLRASLSKESLIWHNFLNQDNDIDGYINVTEFSYLLYDLGLEYDDFNLQREFDKIDTDMDHRITYKEFQRWWKKVQSVVGTQ